MSNSVPVGWSLSLLSDLANIRSSNVDKKSSSDEIPVRLCNYTDVYYNNQITSKIKFMEATAKQNQIDRFSIQAGDVIITKDSETPDDIAIPAYVAESFTNVLCGYHLSLIRPEKDKASGSFLSHLFGLASVRHHFYILANGITRYGLNIDAIENAPILAPPLPEQQKIAAILTSVDDVIESTQAQINKLKDLKTGMMQELLTKGIGHTEFKDSPVGRIPKEWEVQKLGDVCSLQGGYAFKSTDATTQGCRWLKIANVGKGNISWDDSSFLPVTFSDLYNDFLLKDGDIVVALTRPVLNGELKVAKLHSSDAPALLNQRVARVIPKPEKVLKDFVYTLFVWKKMAEDIESAIFGTDPPNVSTKQIESLIFPIPTMSEQKIISESLNSVNDSYKKLQLKLGALMATKKALMQDLLTGKVRVKVS